MAGAHIWACLLSERNHRITIEKNTPLILSFSNIRATDLPRVGGKGANLGELTHAGFPIPGGFCLTTAAFHQFMQASPDFQSIYKQLDTIATDNIETVRKVGDQIRQSLLTVPIPADVVQAAKQAWQDTGVEHAYAVRSNAPMGCISI